MMTAADTPQPPRRFVVLRHDGVPDPHFDLMFETLPGGPLETWRSPAWPIATPVRVTPLSPHRREYLSYEGPVSNNRGVVTRVAEGTFESRPANPGHASYLLHVSGSGPLRLFIRAGIAELERD